MVGGRGKREEGSEHKGFRRLRVWHKADQLASDVFQTFNRIQVPGWLVSQVMRAAISVPANIAEGYTRGALKDYLRFLDIARGSLAELDYYLHFMLTNGLLGQPAYERLTSLQSDTGNLLVGLIHSLRTKLADGSWNRLQISEDRIEYLVEEEGREPLPSSLFPLPGGEE